MHNKAWIADGRVAMVGGRNIGVEYFSAATETNFRDLDLVLVGSAVAEGEAIFDDYWNSDAVVPLRAVSKRKIGRLRQLMSSTEEQTGSSEAQAYLQRVRTSCGVKKLLSQQLQLFWSERVSVIADPPQKWRGDDRQHWLVGQLVNIIAASQARIWMISPYFVPGKEGTGYLVERMQNGVEVGVVTNSLAANDVPAVHSGYARYRKPLLESGAQLYELRAQGRPGTSGLFGSAGACLHTKAFVIDSRHGFVGSFNVDARSASLNTEMGVLFDDPELSAALEQEYRLLAGPAMSYSVHLDVDNRLYWEDAHTHPTGFLQREPGASRARRLVAWLLGLLPIESQL